MKSIRSIHIRYLLVSTAIQSLVILFLALPALDEMRTKIAELVGLTPNSLWIPAIALIVVVNYLILKVFKRAISEPILHVAKEIELNKPGTYAFKSISKNEEEKALKHFVESQSMRTTEMETLIDDLENERDQAKRELEVALEKTKRSTQELEETLASRSEIRENAEQLKAQNAVLEEELESARKRNVSGEVEKRTDEIYAQMERAVEAAAYKKIWLPSVLHELKTPAQLIRDLASRIDRSWDDTPLNKLKHEVDEINRHCAAQLKILDEISKRELPHVDAEEEQDRDTANQFVAESAPTEQEIEEKQVILPESRPELVENESVATEQVSDITVSEPETIPPDTNEVLESAIDHGPENEPQTKSKETSIFNIADLPTSVPEIQIQKTPEPEIPEIIADSVVEDETESALEELVSEIVAEYETLSDTFTIDLTKASRLDADVDEEEIGSILSNLLEIALNQFSSGTIRLKAEQSDSFLELTLRCDGQPYPDARHDVTQANRIAAAMDQNVTIDMQTDEALYMHLKYRLELGDSFGNQT